MSSVLYTNSRTASGSAARLRRRTGVTKSATQAPTAELNAPIQKAVENADSAGTAVDPIVSAVRIAAPT